jgi:hypothetical protein
LVDTNIDKFGELSEWAVHRDLAELQWDSVALNRGVTKVSDGGIGKLGDDVWAVTSSLLVVVKHRDGYEGEDNKEACKLEDEVSVADETISEEGELVAFIGGQQFFLPLLSSVLFQSSHFVRFFQFHLGLLSAILSKLLGEAIKQVLSDQLFFCLFIFRLLIAGSVDPAHPPKEPGECFPDPGGLLERMNVGEEELSHLDLFLVKGIVFLYIWFFGHLYLNNKIE